MDINEKMAINGNYPNTLGNMIKKVLILIGIALIFLIGIVLYRLKGAKFSPVTFETSIPSGTVFINSKDSKDFIYNCKVLIDTTEVKNNYVELKYIVYVSSKKNRVYKNVIGTVFWMSACSNG